MTDKEKLMQLLKELGIEYKFDKSNIWLEGGYGKVNGDQRNAIYFDFDNNDKFKKADIY